MDTPLLRDVIHSASEKNILIFAAAGNEPVTTPYYPAAYPDVTAVTAVDQGQVASYANRGSFVTLGAPGSSVVYYNNQPFYVVGTSAASAFTSGLAAGYMEATGSAPQKVNDFLRSTYGLKAPSHP
jgi:thermitase